MVENLNIKRLVVAGLIFAFLGSLLQPSYAQEQLTLPAPGTMVNLSPAYVPVLIKGLKVHPENPLLFDFILDTGRSGLKINSPEFKDESEKLIKYFLASLTIKEGDLWVNLSPYEKSRIIPDHLGQTELGRDMLAQDYILKQLTASLIYPERQLGKEFWDKVYAKAQQEFGTSDIPVNTFNKVWIVADKAEVLERNNVGYVVGAHLKVMLEEDYLALNKTNLSLSLNGVQQHSSHALGSQIIREIILPELEKEVNRGQNFAPLRQMFYSMILATWYKLALKNALLNRVYSNKGKMGGILSDDPTVKEKIYEQYLKAYKKGVFNYIKEDMDTANKQTIPRKYFSGGVAPDFAITAVLKEEKTPTLKELGSMDTGDLAMVDVNMIKQAQGVENFDGAMLTLNEEDARIVKEIYDKISELPKEEACGDVSNISTMLWGLTRNPSDDVLDRFRSIESHIRSADQLLNQVAILDTAKNNRETVFLDNLNKIINGELKFEKPFYRTLNFWSILNSKEAESKLKEWDEVRKVYEEIRPSLIAVIGHYLKFQDKDDSIDQPTNKVLFAIEQLYYWYAQRGNQDARSNFDAIFMHPLRDLSGAVNHFFMAYSTDGLEALDSERYLGMTKAFEQALAFTGSLMNLNEEQVRGENIQAQETLGVVTKREFEKENIGHIYDAILPILIKAGYVTKYRQVNQKSYKLKDDFKNAHTSEYSLEDFRKVDVILERLHLPRIFRRYNEVYDELKVAQKIVDSIERNEVEEKLNMEQRLLGKNIGMLDFVSHEDWFDVSVSHRLGILYQELIQQEEQWQVSINSLMREKRLSVELIEKEDKRSAIEGATRVLVDGKYVWIAPDGHLIQSDKRSVPAFKEIKDFIRTNQRNSELESMPREQFVRTVQEYVRAGEIHLTYYNENESAETAVQNLIDGGDFRVSKNKLLNDVKVEIFWRAGIKPDAAMNVNQKGGIDLNAKNMSLDVSGQGIEIKFDPAMVTQFQRGDFSGIVANIIRITPIKSVLPMMGLDAASS